MSLAATCNTSTLPPFLPTLYDIPHSVFSLLSHVTMILKIEQIHVVSAFLHADVVSDTYMEQPEGYYTPSAHGTRLVSKLHKALYGIREAPRAWNALLSSWLVSFGFSQSSVDPAIFTITSTTLATLCSSYLCCVTITSVSAVTDPSSIISNLPSQPALTLKISVLRHGFLVAALFGIALT